MATKAITELDNLEEILLVADYELRTFRTSKSVTSITYIQIFYTKM